MRDSAAAISLSSALNPGRTAGIARIHSRKRSSGVVAALRQDDDIADLQRGPDRLRNRY